MGVFRKSLSEDDVDRYSHTWAFAILLLLSIITLFIPLSPSLRVGQERALQTPIKGDTAGDGNAGGLQRQPKYTARCWTPEQFGMAHIAYTTAACTNALNAALRGQNATGALVFQVDLSDTIPFSSDERKEKGFFSDGKLERYRDHMKKENVMREKVNSDIQTLISYRTPLFLFLLAVLLRVPRAIWSLLSACCGAINVDQTLATALVVHSKGGEAWTALKQSVTSIFAKSKKSSGILYLLMKILMVIVLVVEAIVVANVLLAETEKVENDMNLLKPTNPSRSNSDNAQQGVSGYSQAIQDKILNDIFLCEFKLRMLQNIQTFVVQCLYEEDQDNHGTGAVRETPGNEGAPDESIFLLYKALFTMLLVMLVILIIFNAVSLISWLLSLTLGSCRSGLGFRDDASFDAVFLVSMARCNTSIMIAMELAGNSSIRSGSGKEGEAIGLNDDVVIS